MGRQPRVALRYYFVVVFPTRMKSRISHTLYYLVTAKEISEALANVPQAGALSIDFFHYQRMKDTGKPYAVLSVRSGAGLVCTGQGGPAQPAAQGQRVVERGSISSNARMVGSA